MINCIGGGIYEDALGAPGAESFVTTSTCTGTIDVFADMEKMNANFQSLEIGVVVLILILSIKLGYDLYV